MRGMSAEKRYETHAFAWCADSALRIGKPSQRPRPIRTPSRT